MGQSSQCWTAIYWPFYFHILSTKTSFYHMTKNLHHTTSPDLFLWSPSLEACTINSVLLYMNNEADKLRHWVLPICSTSEIQIKDVSKNFQVPTTFQQCQGMPADCFFNSNFCVFILWIIYFSDSTVVSSFTLSNSTANCCWQVWFYCTSSENMFPLLFPC